MNGETITDSISKADSITSQIEAYLAAHPSVKFLFLAWIFGWVCAVVARIIIKWSPYSEEAERRAVFLSCILFSALAAGRIMWGDDYVFIYAVVIGGLSPFAYLLFIGVPVDRWIPKLSPYLSLRKDFSAALSDEQEPTQAPVKPE